MIIYSPSRSPSTSIRNRQNQRARYISGRAYWDLVETQIKISIGRDRQVEPNTDLDLSRDQIPISKTGYIPSELIFRYGYWWRGLWLGEFVILSVLRILLGFCIYAASQIHDSSHCGTREYCARLLFVIIEQCYIRLHLVDCVVARSATKLGGLGACPHSRKATSTPNTMHPNST